MARLRPCRRNESQSSKASKTATAALKRKPSLRRARPAQRTIAAAQRRHEEKRARRRREVPGRARRPLTSAASGTRRAVVRPARGLRRRRVASTAFGFATRLRLHDGLRLRRRRLHRLRARRPARAVDDRRGRDVVAGALRTGAGCVLVTGGGSGATAFGGGSGDGVAARAGTARTTHSSARPPTGVPLRRSNDHLPCRAISPRSPGLFSKLLRFLGCVNEALRPAGRPEAGLRGAAFCHSARTVFETCQRRRLAPQAGPVPTCGATPFVYSARDLPVAFVAASCSAADRPIANWLFFADWPTACVPPPPD